MVRYTHDVIELIDGYAYLESSNDLQIVVMSLNYYFCLQTFIPVLMTLLAYYVEICRT